MAGPLAATVLIWDAHSPSSAHVPCQIVLWHQQQRCPQTDLHLHHQEAFLPRSRYQRLQPLGRLHHHCYWPKHLAMQSPLSLSYLAAADTFAHWRQHPKSWSGAGDPTSMSAASLDCCCRIISPAFRTRSAPSKSWRFGAWTRPNLSFPQQQETLAAFFCSARFLARHGGWWQQESGRNWLYLAQTVLSSPRHSKSPSC